MKLTIKDRIIFNQFYPEKGNLTEQILVKDIIKKIELTQKDLEKYEIKSEGQQVSWNPKKDKPTDVEFSEAELDLLKKQVDKKDENGEITQDTLDLCVRIKNEGK